MNLAMTDTPDIPAFLRVTPEERQRRIEWNREHPVQPMRFTDNASVDRKAEQAKVKARLAQLQAEEAEERTQKTDERRAKAAGKVAQRPPGSHWDSRVGKWKLDKMSQRDYERLLAEMPTDAHRAALTKIYKAEGAAAPVTKVAKPVETRPPVAAAKPAAGPARLPKAEQVAKVTAMLLRPEGATLPEIGAAMGWLNHSASAFISGLRKQFKQKIPGVESPRGRAYKMDAV